LNGTVTLTFDLVTSKFIGVIFWPWPIFLPSTMNVTYKLFKILSGHGFCIKWYCDLDLWPSHLKFYRDHLLTMTNLATQVPWLSFINFLRYWADMVFALNGTVTLTFDLMTSKYIGVIYWPCPIFLTNTMTVTHKLFKILSGHCFCIKWYCDLYL